MMARSINRSNQRPDILMQDRKAARSMKPLATHGRTIQVGQERRFRDVRSESGLPPTAERSRQRSEPTLRAITYHSLLCSNTHPPPRLLSTSVIRMLTKTRLWGRGSVFGTGSFTAPIRYHRASRSCRTTVLAVHRDAGAHSSPCQAKSGPSFLPVRRAPWDRTRLCRNHPG